MVKLFKIKKSESQSFKEGKIAFSNGVIRTDNPYRDSDINMALEWERGWDLAFRDRQAFLGKHRDQARSGQSSLPKPVAKYMNIENHVQRLIQIEDALGEIGKIFEDCAKTVPSSDSDALNYIVDNINKLRIPGFLAYHLANEGISLLHIITALCVINKESIRESSFGKIDQVLKHIDEVELYLRKTLYDMEPYESMDAKKAIEVIATRIAREKGK